MREIYVDKCRELSKYKEVLCTMTVKEGISMTKNPEFFSQEQTNDRYRKQNDRARAKETANEVKKGNKRLRLFSACYDKEGFLEFLDGRGALCNWPIKEKILVAINLDKSYEKYSDSFARESVGVFSKQDSITRGLEVHFNRKFSVLKKINEMLHYKAEKFRGSGIDKYDLLTCVVRSFKLTESPLSGWDKVSIKINDSWINRFCNHMNFFINTVRTTVDDEFQKYYLKGLPLSSWAWFFNDCNGLFGKTSSLLSKTDREVVSILNGKLQSKQGYQRSCFWIYLFSIMTGKKAPVQSSYCIEHGIILQRIKEIANAR